MSDCFVKLNIGNSTVFSINTDGTYVRTISPIDNVGYNSDIVSQDECRYRRVKNIPIKYSIVIDDKANKTLEYP